MRFWFASFLAWASDAIAAIPARDDLTAVMDATTEATPIHDAVLAEIVAHALAIEIACDDFAAEVQALADIELRDLLGDTTND